MMTAKGLPGIEALFRDYTRLSRKLTTEEMGAVRRYIGERVQQEHDTLLFKIRHLTAAHELNQKEYQRSLDTLQKELEKEKWVSREFKREFSSLTKVLQQRDERFRLKHETLVADLKKARRCQANAEEAKERLSNEVRQKEDLVRGLEIKANELRDKHRKRCENLEQKFSEEKSRQEKMILKLKYELSLKDKEISNLKADLHEARTINQKPVKFKDTGCSDSACKTRADLEICRAHLVQKCKEISNLRYQIEQGKQRIREQAKLLNYMSPVLRQRDEAKYGINAASRTRRRDECTPSKRNIKSQPNRK